MAERSVAPALNLYIRPRRAKNQSFYVKFNFLSNAHIFRPIRLIIRELWSKIESRVGPGLRIPQGGGCVLKGLNGASG